MPRTLFQKLWDSHVIELRLDGSALLYVDRHLVYEVTSPQAFEGLRLSGRKPRRPTATLATADHNVPTVPDERSPAGERIRDRFSKQQVAQLNRNCDEFKIPQFRLGDTRQGIIHVIGPEQGATLPGMAIVAGDSHTSTHGAFAALAFGVGTSEVEHVLATQCLWVQPMRTMKIDVHGDFPKGTGAKDLILEIIRRIGTAGATGYAIEFTGPAIRLLSMEARMTLCNMAIEAGARVGLVAVDQITIDYVRGRPMAPSGAMWDCAEAYWRSLVSDEDAAFDVTLTLDAAALRPMVTWGTSPEMVTSIDGTIPDPQDEPNLSRRAALQRALEYMDLAPGTAIRDITLDRIFIGSCTNSRIEDLRAAAAVVKGKHVAPSILQALVVPGSGLVKAQAESEGLNQIFLEAGFQWREPGCSMCLGMNDDRLKQGERCASTSNRNFEGRQGAGGRTHLVSPVMAAAAAIAGRFEDATASQE